MAMFTENENNYKTPNGVILYWTIVHVLAVIGIIKLIVYLTK